MSPEMMSLLEAATAVGQWALPAAAGLAGWGLNAYTADRKVTRLQGEHEGSRQQMLKAYGDLLESHSREISELRNLAAFRQALAEQIEALEKALAQVDSRLTEAEMRHPTFATKADVLSMRAEMSELRNHLDTRSNRLEDRMEAMQDAILRMLQPLATARLAPTAP